MKFKKFLSALVLAAVLATGAAFAAYDHGIMNPEVTPATAVTSLPAACRILADDLTNLRPIFIDCGSFMGLNAGTTANGGTVNTIDINGGTIDGTVIGGSATAAGHFTSLGASGVTTATGGLVSTTTNDLSPVYSTGITANPVAMITKGSCTVAAVNAGTCKPLVGVAARTITVTHFDIVATGSAATCTGVFLEDDNGSPVVIATLAAATLTSGSHNVPLAATLGAGFGAGAGLTAAKGVQLIKNGSDCATTTSFGYTITYTLQ